MKKLRILLPILFVLALLAACGGKQEAQTAAAAPATAAETTKETVKETEKATQAAVETTEAADTETEEETEEEAPDDEDSGDGGSAAGELTKDGFIEYFDMLLEDAENKEEFFVEYDGKNYYYADLGNLYEDIREKDDGFAPVKLLGEEEEDLDFEIMAEYLAFFKDAEAGGWGGSSDNTPDRELIDRFYGDWHGVVQFQNRTGKYVEALGGDPTTAIARIYIDEDGYVIPFIGLHVEETPFEGLEGELDTADECIYLKGSWISVPFENIPLTEEDGTLHCEIPISKEAGSFTMVFNLRHLNDIHWEGIDPALPEDYIVHCQGWTFDQLAEANGYTSWDYVSYSAGEEPEYPVQIAQEEEKEDFGKTTEDADGVVSRSVLQEGYNEIMDEMDISGHDPITYEKIRDWFGGTDGVKESPAQWTESRHKYGWQTSDGKDWVSIIFTVNADGSETLNTINQSQAILDGR